MPDKVKISYGGKMVDATRVSIDHSSEQFNEYLIGDGTTLRIKLVLADVLKVDGHFDADGNPVYLCRSQNVLSIHAPDSLKKTP